MRNFLLRFPFCVDGEDELAMVGMLVLSHESSRSCLLLRAKLVCAGTYADLDQPVTTDQPVTMRVAVFSSKKCRSFLKQRQLLEGALVALV